MTEMNASSGSSFTSAIRKGVTLVDFNAPWCAPCRAQDLILADVERSYNGKATVMKLNVDDYQKIARNMGIHSIPTIVIYKDGRERSRLIGLQTAGALSRALNDVLTENTFTHSSIR